MFNEMKFYIGSLCKKGHSFDEGSLRYKSTNQCVECHKEWTKSYSKLETTKTAKRVTAKKSYHKNKEKNLKRQEKYRKTDAFKESSKKSREKHKDKALEKNKAWRKNNKSHISSYNANYAFTHKEELLVKAKKYAEENKDKIHERARIYRENNSEKIKKQQKRYRDSDIGKLKRRILQRKREAIKSGNGYEPYTSEELIQRFALFDNCCAYCCKKVILTIDHFVSLISGGADALYNIVPACGKCNHRKSKTPVDKWYCRQTFFNSDRLNFLYNMCQKNGALNERTVSKEGSRLC
jgi:hypothetical protein